MTLCPALRAMTEREVPKPEEQPVMSQTRGLKVDDIVNFVILLRERGLYKVYETSNSVGDRKLYT